MARKREMPWGKHKGVRLRLIPDSYLSWLTTCEILKAPEWDWLFKFVVEELNWRGLRSDLAATPDPEEEAPCDGSKKHRQIEV